MSKLVVVEIGEGDFEERGFPVTLKIAADGRSFDTQVTGSLPPDRHLQQAYENWHLSCLLLGSPTRIFDDSTNEIKHDSTLNPIDECRASRSRIRKKFK